MILATTTILPATLLLSFRQVTFSKKIVMINTYGNISDSSLPEAFVTSSLLSSPHKSLGKAAASSLVIAVVLRRRCRRRKRRKRRIWTREWILKRESQGAFHQL